LYPSEVAAADNTYEGTHHPSTWSATPLDAAAEQVEVVTLQQRLLL